MTKLTEEENSVEYNEEHGITPQTIVKSVRDVIEIGTHAESGKKGNSRKVLNRSENAAILTDEERNALIQELSRRDDDCRGRS